MPSPFLLQGSRFLLNTIVSCNFVEIVELLLTTGSLTVSTAYNFTSSGPGHYSFAAVNRFHYVDPETGEPVEFYAEQPQAHTTAVSGKLSVARPALARRETYNGTFPGMSGFLSDSPKHSRVLFIRGE